MDKLPFADENLEKEGYKNFCDELSTTEAQNNHTSWGRWFLDDDMLCTWVCVPKMGVHVVGKMFVYEISVKLCRTEKQQEQWLQQMSEKNWMGQSGISDLKRAFKYISKKEKLVEEI